MANYKRYYGEVTYRPADTDSSDEDDYEGFSFGGPGHDEPKEKSRSFWVADPDQDLYDAVCNGNLEELIKQVQDIDFDINLPIKGGLTLLHHACKYGHFAIAKYLVEKGANVNRQVDSTTPLMEACCCVNDEKTTINLMKLLLDAGAVVNVSDKYGTTPFMFACQNGYADVVKLLIQQASLEAIDNQGRTALFYAIENNRPEVVKLLVKLGVNSDVSNIKGYTPRQVADFYGFFDILDLLPAEEYTYFVPTTYMSYNTFRDYIPRIFGKSETPEYFQEICSILRSLNLETFLPYFAVNEIDLANFLTATDDDLASYGIQYPFHRGKIKLGILNYHRNHWSKSSIARVSRQGLETSYDILMIAANQIQNLVVVNSSLKYILQNLHQEICGNISKSDVETMRRKLREYKIIVTSLQKTFKYISEFSPEKPPLLIDYAEYKATQRKKKRLRNYLKYSIFIGISIVICLKIKKVM